MRLSPVCLNANLNIKWRGFYVEAKTQSLSIIAEPECRPAEIAELARTNGALIRPRDQGARSGPPEGSLQRADR
jgi:hypothetical protein